MKRVSNYIQAFWFLFLVSSSPLMAPLPLSLVLHWASIGSIFLFTTTHWLHSPPPPLLLVSLSPLSLVSSPVCHFPLYFSLPDISDYIRVYQLIVQFLTSYPLFSLVMGISHLKNKLCFFYLGIMLQIILYLITQSIGLRLDFLTLLN